MAALTAILTFPLLVGKEEISSPHRPTVSLGKGLREPFDIPLDPFLAGKGAEIPFPRTLPHLP
jgi:hypothetical protein